MADLSRVQTRLTSQKRKTNNRDSIIPSRRDTDAGPRRVYQDVRNGSRGDGGVAELRRALGLVNEAASDFQKYADADFADTEEKLGSQGAFDEAAGQADPELIRKSRAYRGSVYTQRAQTAFYQNAEKLDDEVKAVLNSDDPELKDPLKRAAAIQQVIDQNFQQFAIDPESGKLRDWGAPEAAKWLGTQMGNARAEVTAKALQMVEERANEESIDQAATAFGASIQSGRMMSFEDAMSTLLPTADRKVAKQRLILVAKDQAATLVEKAAELDDTDPTQARELRVRALEVIDSIRGSKRLITAPGAGKPIGETPAGEPIITADAPADVSVDAQMAAVEWIESRGKQSAVSHAGAVGVMQVMPKTGPEAARLAGLPWDPKRFRKDEDYNRKLGQAYYKKQLADFGDPIKAAAAYNAGPGRVRGLIAKHGDNWKAKLPAETKDYIKKFAERLQLDASKSYGSGPSVPPNVLDPMTSSDLAAADPVGASSPLYSLTPQERAELGAFRRQLKSDIDKADEEARDKRQTTLALDYMGRFHGMGAYPTPTEIQEAARNGDISVSQAVQLLGIYEQDQNQVEADARAARAEARETRADAREAKADQIDSYAADILGNLVSGKYRRGARDANEALLKLIPTIEDKDVRAAVHAEVTRGIAAHVDLRNASPQYRRAMGRFDEWEGIYLQQLERGRRIHRNDRGRAKALVKNWVNDWRVRLSQDGALSPEAVDKYMAEAEKDLDARFDRRFPLASLPQVRGAGR